jgi:hypothetical protein
MAVTFVTQNTDDWPNSVGASRGHTITSPAAGDLLLWTLTSTSGAGVTTSITGGGVTTWAELYASAFSNYHVAIWWGVVDGTPSTSITSNYSGAKNGCVNISQFTGASAWAANNTARATATSTTKSAGSATPSTSGDFVHIVVSEHIGGDSPSAGPTDGFTALTEVERLSGLGTGLMNNSAYRIDTGAATAGNPTWTINSQVWEGVHGIIKATLPAGGAGPSGSGVLRNLPNLRSLAR